MSQTPDQYDLVLTGGTVIDPASNTNAVLDVGVRDGAVTAIGPSLDRAGASVLDCSGAYVVPGLVEGHSHIFQYVSKVGAPPVEAHLQRGVVAVADAGTAGASTFEAFKKIVVERSPMRIVNFLNVSYLGLIDFRFGELMDPSTLSVQDALAVAQANPETVRGFKIRLSDDVVGDHWESSLRTSLDLAEQAGLPLMMHIGETTEPLDVVLEYLRPGDIVAHCYTGKPHGILDGEVVSKAVRVARERGVLFDSAHGKSNLSFEVARRAIADGFLPDILCSDLSARNWRGPVFDLVTSISKLVALGAPLTECIRRATVAPAKVLGLAEEGYGRLEVGGRADITVLSVTDEVELPDASGNTIVAPRFEPVHVLQAGRTIEITPWRGLAEA